MFKDVDQIPTVYGLEDGVVFTFIFYTLERSKEDSILKWMEYGHTSDLLVVKGNLLSGSYLA